MKEQFEKVKQFAKDNKQELIRAAYFTGGCMIGIILGQWSMRNFVRFDQGTGMVLAVQYIEQNGLEALKKVIGDSFKTA